MKNFSQKITTNIIINKLNMRIQKLSVNDFNTCEMLFNNIMLLIKISITLMKLTFKYINCQSNY